MISKVISRIYQVLVDKYRFLYVLKNTSTYRTCIEVYRCVFINFVALELLRYLLSRLLTRIVSCIGNRLLSKHVSVIELCVSFNKF